MRTTWVVTGLVLLGLVFGTSAYKKCPNCGLGEGEDPCHGGEVVVKAVKLQKPAYLASPEAINHALLYKHSQSAYGAATAPAYRPAGAHLGYESVASYGAAPASAYGAATSDSAYGAAASDSAYGAAASGSAYGAAASDSAYGAAASGSAYGAAASDSAYGAAASGSAYGAAASDSAYGAAVSDSAYGVAASDSAYGAADAAALAYGAATSAYGASAAPSPYGDGGKAYEELQNLLYIKPGTPVAPKFEPIGDLCYQSKGKHYGITYGKGASNVVGVTPAYPGKTLYKSPPSAPPKFYPQPRAYVAAAPAYQVAYGPAAAAYPAGPAYAAHGSADTAYPEPKPIGYAPAAAAYPAPGAVLYSSAGPAYSAPAPAYKSAPRSNIRLSAKSSAYAYGSAPASASPYARAKPKYAPATPAPYSSPYQYIAAYPAPAPTAYQAAPTPTAYAAAPAPASAAYPATASYPSAAAPATSQYAAPEEDYEALSFDEQEQLYKAQPTISADPVSISLAYKNFLQAPQAKKYVPEDRLAFGHRRQPADGTVYKVIANVPEEKLLTVDKPIVELKKPTKCSSSGYGGFTNGYGDEDGYADLEALERETEEASERARGAYVSYSDLGYGPVSPSKNQFITKTEGTVAGQAYGPAIAYVPAQQPAAYHHGAASLPYGSMGPTVPGYKSGRVLVEERPTQVYTEVDNDDDYGYGARASNDSYESDESSAEDSGCSCKGRIIQRIKANCKKHGRY